jgi:hypothetical protein
VCAGIEEVLIEAIGRKLSQEEKEKIAVGSEKESRDYSCFDPMRIISTSIRSEGDLSLYHVTDLPTRESEMGVFGEVKKEALSFALEGVQS